MLEPGADQPGAARSSSPAIPAGIWCTRRSIRLFTGRSWAGCAEACQCCGPAERQRKPHRHGDTRRAGSLTGMTMISQRPAAAADRSEAGHWEGDLVRHEALCYRAEVEDLRR